MANFIYVYGMTSVICILIYAIVVLSDGLTKLSIPSLILRFIFSLIVSPVVLLAWILMNMTSRLCISTIKDCKMQIDTDRVYIEQLKQKYTDFDEMEYDEVWNVSIMHRRAIRLNRHVRVCASIVNQYSKLTKFVAKYII